MYKSGSFRFTFTINTNYPHEPPKVKCTQKVGYCSMSTNQRKTSREAAAANGKASVILFVLPVLLTHTSAALPPQTPWNPQIYHPNIDLEGNVCLNILREDWKPVLNLNSVMVGLQYLFLEPNPGDPLNKEAADELRKDRAQFASTVKRSLGGGSVKGVTYDKVVGK